MPKGTYLSKEESKERDRQILVMYLENYTLDDCGQKFGGLTRERVRQILSKMGCKRREQTVTMHRETLTNDRWNRYTSQERFWRNADKSGGEDACWIWQGGFKAGGQYGGFSYKGKAEYAHHIAFLFANKHRAKGCVLHTCDVSACVNPKHLYEGTQIKNVQDRNERRFDYWYDKVREGRGTIKPTTKFWATDVEMMKILRKSGLTYKQIADQFNTKYGTISRILNGKVQAYQNFL